MEKELKKNGERIKKSTIKQYYFTLKHLAGFQESLGKELRFYSLGKLNARTWKREQNYWKRFYKNFSGYLYKKGYYDNYIGQIFKNLRTFFNWLHQDKNINAGDFHKAFFVRKEEVPIIVLNTEQLKFLIHNKDFHLSLDLPLRNIKDIFVFGCTVGLRFSDLFRLKNQNIEAQSGNYYLKAKSKKTKAITKVKLPDYALDIIERSKLPNKETLFKPYHLTHFNKQLKKIGEKAGWTYKVEKLRSKKGIEKRITAKNNKSLRFCDQLSSHTMRRTAITNMLILGMPEHMVRSVSGHSSDSKSFYRYVKYAQAYLDTEIDKIYEQLSTPNPK